MRRRAATTAAGALLAAAAAVAVIVVVAGGTGGSAAARPLSATERIVYDRIVGSRHVAGARGPVRPPNGSISGCTLRSVSRVGTLASVVGASFDRPGGEIAIRVHEDAAGTIEISLYTCA